MPGLAAIFYCLNMHAPTGTPITAPANGAAPSVNNQQLDVAHRQRIARGLASMTDDVCFSEVAKRLAVPQNAPGNLAKIYQDNVALCQTLNPYPNNPSSQQMLSPTDYANCTGATGISYYTIDFARTCPIQNPSYVNYHFAAGEATLDVKKHVEGIRRDCIEWQRKRQEQNDRFVQIMGSRLSPEDTELPGAH